MIYKTFQLKKIPDKAIFYLLYGKNEGLKTDCINQILEKMMEKFLIMMKNKLRMKLKHFMKIYYLVHYLKVKK